MASVKGGAVVHYINEIMEHRNDKARVDYLVSQYEVEADQQLALSKTLTKMGPILGLMGTLIPMGPALVGLSSGDIASMAYNMQVAFATTVVGMVISAIGFVTQQAKERWFVRDLSTLEFVADTVTVNK
jgi:biopolymer transport protein ExbB/TolQ